MPTPQTNRDRFPDPVFLLPWVAGRWYPTALNGQLSTGAPGAASMFMVPTFVPNPAGVTATSIGIEVTTAGTAGHTVRLGIYLDEDGMPGDLLLDAGTVAVDPGAVPAFQSITISQFLAQGWYWMAFITQSGTVRMSVSGSHPGLFVTKQDEGTTGNNPLGLTITPATRVATLWQAVGLPKRVMISTRPSHANYPRIMIGV